MVQIIFYYTLSLAVIHFNRAWYADTLEHEAERENYSKSVSDPCINWTPITAVTQFLMLTHHLCNSNHVSNRFIKYWCHRVYGGPFLFPPKLHRITFFQILIHWIINQSIGWSYCWWKCFWLVLVKFCIMLSDHWEEMWNMLIEIRANFDPWLNILESFQSFKVVKRTKFYPELRTASYISVVT